jgi:hypothetical protein
MKCEKAQELFSEHLEGALERPMAVAFERHLAECPECERDYSAFRMTWQMLETMPEVEVPLGFAYGVISEIEARREAEAAAAGWWQRALRDLFASKVPARAFAAGAAVLVLAAAVVSPVGDYVGATLGIKRTHKTPPAVSSHTNTTAGLAWLESGLSIGLDQTSSKDGWSRLLLKSEDGSRKQVSVYIMEPGRPKFDSEGLAKARQVFDGEISGAGQVVQFTPQQGAGVTDVATALVRWEHNGRSFAEVVFVPIRATQVVKGSVQIESTELYSALQEISSAFGVVILANADINRVVESVGVKDGNVNDALYQLSNSTDLRWRTLGARVYIIERKVE